MTEKLDCQGDKVTNGGEKEDRENVFNISCLHDQKLKNKLTETGEMAQRLRCIQLLQRMEFGFQHPFQMTHSIL